MAGPDNPRRISGGSRAGRGGQNRGKRSSQPFTPRDRRVSTQAVGRDSPLSGAGQLPGDDGRARATSSVQRTQAAGAHH